MSLVLLLALLLSAPGVVSAQAPAAEIAAARAAIDALAKERKWAEAIEAVKRLLEIGERHQDLDIQAESWHRLGRAHNSLGVLAWQQGNAALVRFHFSAAADAYHAAGDVAQEASAIRNITFATDMPTGERVTTLERAWALVSKTDNKEIQGLVLHHLGDMLNAAGEFTRAIEKLEAALPLLEQHSNNTRYAAGLTSLGRTLRLHGQHERALDIYQRVRVLQEAASDVAGLAQTWDAIANALDGLGRQADALAAREKAFSLSSDTNTELRLSITTNFAHALVRSGDVKRALALLEPLAASELPRRSTVHLYNTLGDAYHRVGRLADALRAIDRSMRDVDELELVELTLSGLQVRAAIKRDLGDLAGALADARRALEMLERLRAQAIPRDAMKRTFVDQHHELFALAIDLEHRAGDAAAALEISERARARAFVDLLASRALETGTQSSPARTAGDPDLPSAAAMSPPAVDAIRSAVRALNTTLISYWVEPDAIRMWVVLPDGTIASRRVDVKNERIDTLSRQIAHTVDGATRGAASLVTRGGATLALGDDPRPALRELYKLLIEPIAPHLSRQDDALVTIVPHGPLFGVPFAALVDPRGRYFVEQYRLHVVPSAAMITASPAARPVTRRDALVIADPVPMPDSTPALPPLPGARAEAQAIARLFPRGHVTLLTGRDATRSRVESGAGAPAVLHLATHGLVFDDRPFDSFLALAGRSGEARLAASDIYRMSLKANLVVLSACRTASGIVSGDGVMGLARAFFYAGAPSVVASLWDLPDAAARELMPAFYRSWLRDGDSSGALRAAQLSYIRALRRGEVVVDTPLGTVKVPEHPALWAGMVLIGRP